MNQDPQKLYEQQQQVFDEYRQKNPQMLENPKKLTEAELFPVIGILNLPPKRPQGYIRLFPQDFIVEEVEPNEIISTIEPTEDNKINLVSISPIKDKFHLHCSLVKVKFSTLEAINFLAQKFNLKSQQIGHAGIKDVFAITSQKISLPQVYPEQIQNLKTANFYFKNFSFQNEQVATGYLLGNRFTITIRTEKEIDPNWLKQQLVQMKTNGILNYFNTQRFGAPRFIAHKLGFLLVEQKYEEAVRAMLIHSNNEIKLIQHLRKQAEKKWQQWTEMKTILKTLPITFANEIKILEYLEKDPQNFKGVFYDQPEKTKLYFRAYGSYIFNNYISQKDQEKQLPKKTPLPLTDDPHVYGIYKKWHKISYKNFSQGINAFNFLPKTKLDLKTKLYPQEIKAMTTDQGCIIHFTLPKGAYATTLLTNLFELSEGMPIPQWIKTKEIDAKNMLQMGTYQSLKNIFDPELFQNQELERLNLNN